ncbi:hypothetical protein CVD25_05275 [Bacillus canaveralius]|uniref:Uncharacterized protein n=1 Tax=Bacillus canaveralius TaxID=1403243 RepID=A0A2N5GRQ2_9BACI|nr:MULTISPECIES: hypothetical protein [Bacillus]PLR82637.1 hypothetical protein CVD23_15625 [Bacillus sp. V33-4]PLR86126.1 hypothetical protein CU635_03565 [Bacillus canaveralius]PLS00246.1 hypothetical protein CVD25_05275 [Bacillus canaveralius]RSK51990.1 hypothetical protein EJA13_12490 [Bacillus canaveralius]
MEGIIFYWISWLIWILATFFLKKENRYRFRISLAMLIAIMLSTAQFSLFGFSFYWAPVVLLLFVYWEIAKLKKGQLAYYIICALIVTLAYVSFLLFELFDPVWVLFDRKLMLGFIIVYLIVVLYEDIKMRICILLSGAFHGEVVFALIIKKLAINYKIGALEFLDLVALAAGVLLGWNGLKYAILLLEKTVSQFEREKQKTS